MVSLLIIVLFLQIAIYLINALGAKTINELVGWSNLSSSSLIDEM